MPRKKFKKHTRYRKNTFRAKNTGSGLKKIFPKFIILVVLLAAILFFWSRANNFFVRSSFFNVSKIELTMKPFLKEALSLDFYNIPPRFNIFQLNIDAVGFRTQKKHPEFKSVVILRKPPDIISVTIEYKTPIAFIKTRPQRKFFHIKRQVFYQQWGNYILVPISGDGIVLPPDVAKGKILPILSGVDFEGSVVNVGNVCNDKKLSYAIRFLIMAQSCWQIRNHRIDVIEVGNLRDVSIFLENGIEIKLGEGNVKKKINDLKNILEVSRLDLTKIKYIDLRFSNAVIGPKEPK